MAYAMGMRFASRFGRFAARALRRVPRVLRRRRPVRRLMRKKTQNKIHTFVRWADKDTQYPGSTGPNVITETGANQHLAYSFKLDNVVNRSDFSNLYDMYRVNKITLHFEPTYDTTAAGSVLGVPNGKRIRVVHDYNDNNVLADEDEYLEYSNCKSYFPWSRRGIIVTLYPKVNNVIENVLGAPTAYTSIPASKQWFNIVDDEIPMFGLKVFIPGNLTPGVDAQLFKVRAKFHLSMKNSK